MAKPTGPEVGKPAPAFTLPSQTGEEISLSGLRGKNAVLYFYPKDDTPGCTAEACSFRDTIRDFEGEDTVILGVSADSLKSHQKFGEKYGLPFRLLSDEGAKVATEYGVWKEKSRYGKTYMGLERTTFVIDKKGILRKIYPNVKVDGHIEEVLGFVRTGL